MNDNNNCIGIDIGYGFTKTCNTDGCKIFPTAVRLMTREHAFANVTPITVNGHRYFVGSDAENGGGIIDTRCSDFVTSDAWLATLGHALNINGFISGDIVLGLPPGMFTKEYTTRVVESLKGSSIQICDSSQFYTFNGNVRIVPQGAGIFFRYIKDCPEHLKKNIVVIDIGHHTLDMALFADGKYIEDATESREIGVSTILDRIIKGVYREYRKSISHRQAIKVLENGYVTIRARKHPVNVQEELLDYSQRLNSIIDHYLNELSVDMDMGIIGGGGALAVQDYLQFEQEMFLVSDPTEANAIGYWYYGINT